MARSVADGEVTMGKALDTALLKRLVVYLRPHKWRVILAVVMAITAAFLGALLPKLSQVAIDDHILKGDMPGLLWIIAAMVGLMILNSLMQYGLTYLMQYVGQQTIHAVRMKLFTHLQDLSMRFYDTNPVGRLVTRVTSDVEVLNEFFSSGLVMIVANIFTIIWIVVLMFVMSVPLTLLTLVTVVLLLWTTSVFRVKVRAAYREVRYQLSRMNAFINENITGVLTVKLFGQEKRMNREFAEINKAHTDANVRSVFYYAVFFPVVNFLSMAAVALIIWYGGTMIAQEAGDSVVVSWLGSFLGGETLTFGIIFAFYQYTERFFRPIRDLSEKYNILQNAMASSERIFELMDTDIPTPQATDDAVPFAITRGEIDFKDVCFSYDGENRIIRDLSFHVNPGETLAIVGATGAGKTTIINILMRYYDYESGRVAIDDRDLKTIRTKDLRRDIAVVMQDIFTFRGTLMDNITLNDETISRQQAIAAAKTVGISRYIDTLPKGYDTEVRERGATLSMGQRQLISFARALARDPRILILDEATSNVDTETEKLIQEAISKLLEGRTSIVIAHRLSTIRSADKILVMHKGRLREMGTHEELLDHDGIYAKLYRLQYKRQETEV
ncbi:MAG: ABC transporter ATP-binding protein [Chlorobi bacterium]|nr:ABC transporter ATP-binding protein [Chlorobiota bacterium]